MTTDRDGAREAVEIQRHHDARAFVAAIRFGGNLGAAQIAARYVFDIARRATARCTTLSMQPDFPQ